MAEAVPVTNGCHYSSPSVRPHQNLPSQDHSNRLRPTKQRGTFGLSMVTCSSSNGRVPDSVDGVKSVERLLEEKRRAELSARIASGEFTVEKTGTVCQKLGVPREILDFLFSWADAHDGSPKIPEAKGAISAIQSEAFFIPLYELYLTYGGIYRLTLGPKIVMTAVPLFWVNYLLIFSAVLFDPSIAKHILRDNSKGSLAEILEFVMGKGLIPADGEIWSPHCIRRYFVLILLPTFNVSSGRKACLREKWDIKVSTKTCDMKTKIRIRRNRCSDVIQLLLASEGVLYPFPQFPASEGAILRNSHLILL